MSVESSTYKEMSNQACQECGKPISGRVDKKFCDVHCRNAYHNRTNGKRTNYMRNVNRILRKNRSILRLLLEKGHQNASRQMLSTQGFDFNYYTTKVTSNSGDEYIYCYEMGYMPKSEDLFTLMNSEGDPFLGNPDLLILKEQ